MMLYYSVAIVVAQVMEMVELYIFILCATLLQYVNLK